MKSAPINRTGCFFRLALMIKRELKKIDGNDWRYSGSDRQLGPPDVISAWNTC
jgi:hypothetical protein